MEFANLVDGALEFRQNYPEVISAVLGVFSLAALFLVRKMFQSKPLSAEGKVISDLLKCQDRWRWGTGRGVTRGKPTFNSIVCEGNNGKKVVCILSKDKYSIDDEVVDLSKSDVKKLRVLKDSIVSILKSNDEARLARETARKRQDRIVKLNTV